jgi:hypothetical protein
VLDCSQAEQGGRQGKELISSDVLLSGTFLLWHKCGMIVGAVWLDLDGLLCSLYQKYLKRLALCWVVV